MNNHFLILRNQRRQGEAAGVKREEEEGPLPEAPRRTVKARPLLVKAPGQGKWSKKEQTAYIQFLTNQYDTMSRGKLRKTKKIFIKMSRRVRTRVPEQCRSHHQKMMELHGSLEEIIRFFKEEVFPLGAEPQTLQKTVKTQVKVEHNPLPQFYRVEQSGNYLRLEINCDQMASY